MHNAVESLKTGESFKDLLVADSDESLNRLQEILYLGTILLPRGQASRIINPEDSIFYLGETCGGTRTLFNSCGAGCGDANDMFKVVEARSLSLGYDLLDIPLAREITFGSSDKSEENISASEVEKGLEEKAFLQED